MNSYPKKIMVQIFRLIFSPIIFLTFLLKPKIKKNDDISHQNWIKFLKNRFNKPNIKILEIGSRVVTGQNLKKEFNKAE